MPTEAVLCYIRDGGRVLLQHKAEGRFGGGFWNAPGGKIVDGESPEQAAALRTLHCDEIQGYLVGRPVSWEDMAVLLEESRVPESV